MVTPSMFKLLKILLEAVKILLHKHISAYFQKSLQFCLICLKYYHFNKCKCHSDQSDTCWLKMEAWKSWHHPSKGQTCAFFLSAGRKWGEIVSERQTAKLLTCCYTDWCGFRLPSVFVRLFRSRKSCFLPRAVNLWPGNWGFGIDCQFIELAKVERQVKNCALT